MTWRTRTAAGLVLLVGGCLFTTARGQSSADALVGVWGSEQSLGPLARGELVIDGRAPEWHAQIAGFDVTVHREKDAVSFSVPGGAGEFRGHLSADSNTIAGHWIQPPGVFNNNRYATPVDLSRVAVSVWKGDVAPLEDRASFYLAIRRAKDGSLSAFIKNPEANWFRKRVYSVELKNGSLTLSRSGEQLQATYDPQSDSVFLPLIDSYPPLRFTRRAHRDAVGFYPRVSPEHYVYREPVSANDGWSVASLAEAGMDPQPLSDLIESILQADPADNPVNIQGLLIARHGKLVLEEYFYGFNQERAHDTRSAGKTFATVLVGAAREHGVNIGPDTPVYSLFPEYKPFANWDDRKGKITLADLMTMTPGLACDDRDSSSPGAEDTMQEQQRQPDWHRYTLDLPMAHDPGGEHAIYCSASLNLVGGMVRNATRRWLPEVFDEYFARPLKIRSYHMNLMPNGEAYLGGGIYMRPRDLLKLGQLYLSGGAWNGRRVVSKSWAEVSTARHTVFQPVMESDVDHGYGYGWHTRLLRVGSRVFRDYYAAGNGGQYVLVIPDLDVVVVMTGGSYGERDKFYPWESEFVPRYIIPAVVK